MEQQEQQMIQQPPTMPRNNFNQFSDSALNKHLDNSDILLKLEMMLKGFEYDNDTDEWKPCQKLIGYQDGQGVYVNT